MKYEKYDNLFDYLTFYLFPTAIRLGMTPEQFWDGDPDYFWAYLEAYKQQRTAQLEYDNEVAFLQGLYFTKAIAQCLQFTKSPKRIYPKKPISLNLSGNPEEQKYRELEEYESKRKAQMQMLAKQFEQKNKNRKKTK